MFVLARTDFVQALDELFVHIPDDTRHGDVRVIERRPVAMRRFERLAQLRVGATAR